MRALCSLLPALHSVNISSLEPHDPEAQLSFPRTTHRDSDVREPRGSCHLQPTENEEGVYIALNNEHVTRLGASSLHMSAVAMLSRL